MAMPQSLGKQGQDQLAQKIVERLAAAGFFPEQTGGFPSERFHALRQQVRACFDVPETSITPIMARVLFGLAVSRRPRSIVGLGTYAGNSLVWLAGGALGPDAFFPADEIVGCDTDAAATELAARNFGGLPGGEGVQLLCIDGLKWLEQSADPIDLLYIDIDSQDGRKQGYLAMLQAALPRLRPGSLILAHDVAEPKFAADLAPYLAFVKESGTFQRSATLNIDACGLEVTLR